MSEVDLKPGDKIRHKTGGPDMIVSKVYKNVNFPTVLSVLCEWYSDQENKFNQESFPITSITKIGG